MAAKKRTTAPAVDYSNAPETLEDHIFYGLDLTEEQKVFRDAIWNPEYDAVIVDACAGSGKTTVALATAMMMVQYGRYDKIVYLVAGGVYEHKQGLLPGTLAEKSAPMYAPLYQACVRLGYDPDQIVANDDNILAQKAGNTLITASSNAYIRGTSFGEIDSPVIVIMDEVQNYDLLSMKTAISRINAGSKLIAIGHQGQIDLKYKSDSAFPRLIQVFSEQPWVKICKLTKNFRGRVSALADTL